MNPEGLAVLVTSIATLLGVIFTFVLQLRTQAHVAATAEQVKKIELNTNSLSQRNEAIAKKLGIAEGKAQEKANPSP